MADDLVKEIKSFNGIIEKEDLQNYRFVAVAVTVASNRRRVHNVELIAEQNGRNRSNRRSAI